MGVILCMLYFLHKTKERYTKIIYIFIISGALGNFIDRLFRGYVIDFLDFYIGFYHFPTFNVADIFITIGTFMLVCEFFKGKKENYE